MKITLLLIISAFAIPMVQAGPGRKTRSSKEVVFTQLFEQADANGSRVLNFTEFSNSYGASERPVVTLFRFNQMGGRFIDNRGILVEELGVDLEEFIQYNGGRKINPSKEQIFLTADSNRDGFLSPAEFYSTRIQSASSQASSMKAFDKLDKSDDGQLSPEEFGVTLTKG